METIINKIYVITDDDDYFDKIKYKLKSNKVPVVRVNPLDENKVVDDISSIASKTCSYFCSNKTVSNWLNHYNLWKIIKEKDEDKVLILEDTGKPISSFGSMLQEFWKEVPDDWDIVYLGCTGSCDTSTIQNINYKLTKSKTNGNVYRDGKKMYYVIEPGFPLGLYGYMVSKKGVKKLLKNKELKKIQTDLDYYLAKEIIDNGEFHVYSMTPPLVKYNPKKEDITNHKSLKPITEKVQFNKHSTLDSLWNESLVHIRPLGIDITYITFIIMLISFVVGYTASKNTQRAFIGATAFVQLVELAFTKTDAKKLKNLISEGILIFASYQLGAYIKSKSIKK